MEFGKGTFSSRNTIYRPEFWVYYNKCLLKNCLNCSLSIVVGKLKSGQSEYSIRFLKSVFLQIKQSS